MKDTEQLQRVSGSNGSERALLSGQPAPENDADAQGKRKLPPAPTGTRFKAVGNMVLAMRRFQGAQQKGLLFQSASAWVVHVPACSSCFRLSA